MSKLNMNMDSGHMALSIYFHWMSAKWGDILDSQPRQEKHMSVQDYYDQFFRWRNQLEAVSYIGDEEWYVDDFLGGLKIDLAEKVLKFKWRPRRVSDAFRSATIQETFLSWKENPILIDDEDFEDEFQRAEDACNEKSDDLEVQLAMEIKKIVSPNADKVFDELNQPNFTATTAYTGLNLFPQKLIPVEFVMVKNSYEVFDKMPQLTSVWPYEELHGNKGSIPLMDCVPKVFDPGDGVETVSPFGWRFDEMSKTFPIQILWVSARFPIYDKMPSQVSLEQTRGNDCEVILTVFDPGGITLHDTFKFDKYSVFPNVGKTDSEGFDIHTTAHTSYLSQLDINIVLEWEAISSNSQFELVSLSEVAWTTCWDYLQHCVGGYLLKLSTILMMVTLRIDFSYNHCCKRMWHEKIFRPLIYIYHCLPIAVNNFIWRPCHGKTINYITGMGKYVSGDDGTKPIERPLQELFGQQKAVGYIPWSYDKQTQGQFSELCCQNSLSSVAFALGNGKHQGQSVDEFPLLTQVYKVTKHGDLDIAAAFGLGMEKGSRELYGTVKGNLCVWMFTGLFHSLERRFPGGYKNVVLLMAIILESFVWDPGLSANFFFSPATCSAGVIFVRILLLYILGDKDDFEGKGR